MIQSIIDDVKNQTRERSHGCLSMASERTLVTEIERLRSALQTLIDANDGNLSDVDGALFEARKALTAAQ